MDIVKVTEKQAKYFAGVAPEEYLGMLSMPNVAAFGLVIEHMGVGIMIFSRQGKESLTIEWIYVDEVLRGSGYGAQLMEKIFEAAKILGVNRVCARIPQDENFEAMQLYLLQWGFGWKKTLPGEWNLTVDELLAYPFVEKSLSVKADIPGICKFAKVSNKEIAPAIKDAAKGGRTFLYNVISNRKNIDPDFSVVFKSGNKVEGMLLFHRSGHVLYPVLLWAKKDDTKIISALISASVKAAKDILKGSDVIRITAYGDRSFGFIKYLMPDLKESEAYMMQADADALDRLLEEDIAYKDLFLPDDIPAEGFSVLDIEVR